VPLQLFSLFGIRCPSSRCSSTCGDGQAPSPVKPYLEIRGTATSCSSSLRHRLFASAWSAIRRPAFTSKSSPSAYLVERPRAAAAASSWQSKPFVFGYHDVGVRCLRVCSTPRCGAARRQPPRRSARAHLVRKRARSRELTPSRLWFPKHESSLQRISDFAEFMFSFYYRRMLPPECCARRVRCLQHARLAAPEIRGRGPVTGRSEGESETGATLHEMVAKPDAGRIVDQSACHRPDDLAVEFRKVTDAAEMFSNAVSMLWPERPACATDLSQGIISAGAGRGRRIDWSKSASRSTTCARRRASLPRRFHGPDEDLRTRVENRKAPPGKTGPIGGDEWFARAAMVKSCASSSRAQRMKRILILGVNASSATTLPALLAATDWESTHGHAVRPLESCSRARFHLLRGDITINKSGSSITSASRHRVPLVAIATPATYVKQPLRVFELDFEANLPIVRACVRHATPAVPSSPRCTHVARPRLRPGRFALCTARSTGSAGIYACSKQLMDRVIWPTASRRTRFHVPPFNWIGAAWTRSARRRKQLAW